MVLTFWALACLIGDGAVALVSLLLGACWMAASWRAGGRNVWVLLSVLDLVGMLPVSAYLSTHFWSPAPHQVGLYVLGVGMVTLLLRLKRLPDAVLPFSGLWARRAGATLGVSGSMGIALEGLFRAMTESPKRTVPAVLVCLLLIGAYFRPLWWTMVYGWKLPHEWETT